MAEWLRRWTLNLMGALRAGLISGKDNFFSYSFFFVMMIVERRAAAQASAKRKRLRARMSAANVAASVCLILNHKDFYAIIFLYISMSLYCQNFGENM